MTKDTPSTAEQIQANALSRVVTLRAHSGDSNIAAIVTADDRRLIDGCFCAALVLSPPSEDAQNYLDGLAAVMRAKTVFGMMLNTVVGEVGLRAVLAAAPLKTSDVVGALATHVADRAYMDALADGVRHGLASEAAVAQQARQRAMRAHARRIGWAAAFLIMGIHDGQSAERALELLFVSAEDVECPDGLNECLASVPLSPGVAQQFRALASGKMRSKARFQTMRTQSVIDARRRPSVATLDPLSAAPTKRAKSDDAPTPAPLEAATAPVWDDWGIPDIGGDRPAMAVEASSLSVITSVLATTHVVEACVGTDHTDASVTAAARTSSPLDDDGTDIPIGTLSWLDEPLQTLPTDLPARLPRATQKPVAAPDVTDAPNPGETMEETGPLVGFLGFIEDI